MSIQKLWKDALAWKLAGGAKAAGIATYATDPLTGISLLAGANTLATGRPISYGPAPVAALGDSITAYAATGAVNTNIMSYQPHGFMTWAMGFSMGALWCPLVGTPNNGSPLLNYNRGVSGETAEQVLTRVPELDALPVKPVFCSVLAGTNNLVVNPTQTAESITKTIISICAALLNRGITPVLCTLLPRGNGTSGGWGSLTSGQITTARSNLMDVNRRLRQYAAVATGVILADTFYSILNYSSATSDPVAGLTGAASSSPDYLHPNVPGSQAVGQVWWNAVNKFTGLPARQAAGSGDNYSASNPFGAMWDSSFSTNGGAVGAGASAASAWAATTAYAKNKIVVSSGNIYRAAVGGTSGLVAPIHTVGQAVDGTVCWEWQASAGLSGVPVGWTVARGTGSGAVAEVATSARADGLIGYESTISINPSTDANTTFQSYPTALGGGVPDANFSAGDAIYLEHEVTVDCGSALAYGVPDIQLRASISAYVGIYQLHTTLATSGVATHCVGKFTALFRSPILDTGAANIASISGTVAIDGARTGGVGFMNVTHRNQTIRKYNKSAVGAVTW